MLWSDEEFDASCDTWLASDQTGAFEVIDGLQGKFHGRQRVVYYAEPVDPKLSKKFWVGLLA